jgi:hypothetical protein
LDFISTIKNVDKTQSQLPAAGQLLATATKDFILEIAQTNLKRALTPTPAING